MKLVIDGKGFSLKEKNDPGHESHHVCADMASPKSRVTVLVDSVNRSRAGEMGPPSEGHRVVRASCRTVSIGSGRETVR